VKQALSGAVLAILICGLYATAQQPHVTTTLPSATVKLNGASGSGGGDITGVEVTGTAPVGVTGAACTTGDCTFTLGLDTVPATKGGTGLTTFTLGDIVYSSATNTLAKLAGNTTTTKMFLMQAGNGSVSAAPAWTATAADFPTLNQNTTGSAATLTTARAIYGNNFDGSAALTQVIGSAYGGTGNGFTLFSGPTTSEKTFTLPDASSTIQTGTVSTGVIPYNSGAGVQADTELTRVAQDSYRQVRGTNAQTMAWCMTFTDASNYSCLRYNSSSNVQQLMTDAIGSGAGTNGLRIGTVSNDIRFWVGADRVQISSSQMYPTTSDAMDLGHVSSLPFKSLYLARSIQGSKSKALVDATATNLWQVAVANNSYEGLNLDYTIFATNGTDRQTLVGSVKVAINNNGGTETCVFSTPSEAVNPSTGTLAVTWDCTAGTDTVMIRATADTSLASTTTFTAESRINLTSGTATVTPQ